MALISYIIDSKPSNCEEEQVAPPVVRQVAPLGLEGELIIQREFPLRFRWERDIFQD
jgi:hypothetical protein